MCVCVLVCVGFGGQGGGGASILFGPGNWVKCKLIRAAAAADSNYEPTYVCVQLSRRACSPSLTANPSLTAGWWWWWSVVDLLWVCGGLVGLWL